MARRTEPKDRSSWRPRARGPDRYGGKRRRMGRSSCRCCSARAAPVRAATVRYVTLVMPGGTSPGIQGLKCRTSSAGWSCPDPLDASGGQSGELGLERRRPQPRLETGCVRERTRAACRFVTCHDPASIIKSNPHKAKTIIIGSPVYPPHMVVTGTGGNDAAWLSSVNQGAGLCLHGTRRCAAA